MGVVHLGDMN